MIHKKKLLCILSASFVVCMLLGSMSNTAQAQLSNGSELASQFSDGKTVMVYAHQDDDLIWMLPFYSSSSKIILTAVPISSSHLSKVIPYITDGNYQQKWQALKGSTSDYEYANTALQPCKRLFSGINFGTFKEQLRPIVAASTTKRIITHNNWGEYGHIHHKWINRAIRELATQYGKDVWMLATTANINPGNSYTDLGSMGLPYVRGYFNDLTVNYYRSIYQRAILTSPVNGNYNYDLWSWHDSYWEFPSGTRTFVKIVSTGVDQSSNATVQSKVSQYSSTEIGRCEEPVGTLDLISSGVAQGWTFDGSVSSSAISVQFYVDIPAGQGGSYAGYAGNAYTTQIRTDVNNLFGISGTHGFAWTIPAKYRDGKTHTLYAYGIDLSNAGPNPMLSGSGKTFRLP